jgi:TonB family protein
VGATLALNAETVTDVVYENDEPQKQVPVKKGKQNATIKNNGKTILQVVEAPDQKTEAEAPKTESQTELKVEGTATASEQNQAPKDVFDVVEKMPEFPGGVQELLGFLSKTIKYPAEAEKAGTQGRVIATFVVRKDGSISDARVVKSVDPLLDAEALRVINAMPAWIPGTQNGKPVNVKYTVPISFRLDGKTKGAPTAVGIFTPTDSPAREAREDHLCKEDGSIVAMDVDMEKSTVLRPLFVVDGKIMDGKEVYAINPKTIERFYMQDGQEAIKKYGDKAKDGVVIITLKK